MSTHDPKTANKPGRPTVAPQRRTKIVGAFLRLIAQHGLEGVTLDHIAVEAGVQRAAVRHYVGNRQDLIAAAVEELADRYETVVRSAVGYEPEIGDLIETLFGESWVTDMPTEDSAFDVLLQEATRNANTSPHIRRAYDILINELEQALLRASPDAARDALRDVAYSIACLVEHNVLMQHLGYPRARSDGARAAAHHISRTLR